MADVCFLYYRRSLHAVRRHWTAHHRLLGLTQLGPIPRHYGWKAFKLGDEPVFFSSYQTRWPEVVFVKFKVGDSHALRPELIKATTDFLSHREMWPAEAFLITRTEVASGLWHVLDPDAPQLVFETIRFNCDEHVQQLRIIGPKFSAQFEELSAAAAPFASKSWIDGRYLWVDFDWPCLP